MKYSKNKECLVQVFEGNSQLRPALIDCGLVDCLVLVTGLVCRDAFSQNGDGTFETADWRSLESVIAMLMGTIVRSGAIYRYAALWATFPS